MRGLFRPSPRPCPLHVAPREDRSMPLSWLKRFAGGSAARNQPPKKTTRLGVERLEDRLTPIGNVTPLGGALTAADLVKQLVGAGVKVSNVQYTGTPAA